MGDLMRQYWIPAMRADELAGPDCPPLRVKLLGEELIGFRATSGAVGLVQNACPHRGASLFFGRNEEEGLRCVYHGWKFDVSGACVDMPSEPVESNFRTKVRTKAYPCRERGGIIWTYMGPQEVPPALPDIEANMLQEGAYQLTTMFRDCNWVQGLEGDIDTVHVSFLHSNASRVTDSPGGRFEGFAVQAREARYAVTPTEYGAAYGAYRPAEGDTYYWRIAHFLFPFYSMVPTGVLGVQKIARAWVPMDDEHTLFFHMTDPISRSIELSRQIAQGGDEMEIRRRARESNSLALGGSLPNTTGWLGRFINRANSSNDYLVDRDAQRGGDYTGMPDITTEDQAVTESMGTIYRRDMEHLGTSDTMVIMVRRRLLQAAKALANDGTLPPGVDNPGIYRQRSGGVVLPRSADWWEATKNLRKAFMEHPDLLAARP
jgi:nitrite reductase/ring-hydroxylating ferredoxin subunit